MYDNSTNLNFRRHEGLKKILNFSAAALLLVVAAACPSSAQVLGQLSSVPPVSAKMAPQFHNAVDVEGTVADEGGQRLAGATIKIKGTASAASSDANGRFAFKGIAENAVLVVSHIGYISREVALNGSTHLDIILKSDTVSLSEIAVIGVGYGTERKKDLTGAVESISAKDFNQGAIINPLSQLEGKVAGLVITQQGGNPNDQGAKISIRGQTSISGDQSPLFVVDGVAVPGNSSLYQDLSPSDIASYDVLKDASATAIYGSRGANGVIIVTTKKGRGGSFHIDYDAFAGIASQARYYDLLTTAEYIKAISAIPGVNLSTYETGGNTDWQKAITRKAVIQSNNLALSGGTKEFTYRASLNYEGEQGVVLNNSKRQLGLRFNAEQKALDDKLDISLNLSNTTVFRNELTDGNVLSQDIFNALPTEPIYNKDGSYNTALTGYELSNPIEHLNEITNTQTTYQTLANATVNYQLLPGLKVGVTAILIHDNTLTDYFSPAFPVEGNLNNASQNSYNNNTYEGNVHINYDRTFGKHTISATGVYEYNDFYAQSFSAGGDTYLVPALTDNNLGAGNPLDNRISSSKSDYKIISYLARINYNYDGRFYLTGSVRRDGSDLFGANHQWGTFPSFDVAYRLKRDLLQHVDWINDLKLRAGFGVVGNSSALGPYNALALFGPGQRYYDGSSATYPYPNSYGYVQNPNPDLQWEERQGKNIGLDFSLFDNRLSGDLNYFNDKTIHMLYNYGVPTPPFIYPSIEANVGSMRNKGLEIALTGQALKGDGLNWTINGQITFVQTKVLSLNGTYDGFAVNTNDIVTSTTIGRGFNSVPISYLKPGYPVNEFYLPHFTGLNAQGYEEFDGKTLAQDPNPVSQYVDPNPKFSYGMTNNFYYHNWSLNFVLNGVYGQKIFNNMYLQYDSQTRLPGTNMLKEALSNGINPKDGIVISDYWVQPASYLRLSHAALGYDFKNLKGFSTLRVYLATDNLFLVTKYKGLDPESTGLVDYGQYPKPRTFLIGTNISFK